MVRRKAEISNTLSNQRRLTPTGREMARLPDAFRDALNGLQGDASVRSGGKVGILTPGPMTDTYYEHAYIARYLGFLLAQGEDLTVSDGRLMIRTVAGLTPVSVLWRRLDSGWADPLELDPASRLGTPGMVSASTLVTSDHTRSTCSKP